MTLSPANTSVSPEFTTTCLLGLVKRAKAVLGLNPFQPSDAIINGLYKVSFDSRKGAYEVSNLCTGGSFSFQEREGKIENLSETQKAAELALANPGLHEMQYKSTLIAFQHFYGDLPLEIKQKMRTYNEATEKPIEVFENDLTGVTAYKAPFYWNFGPGFTDKAEQAYWYFLVKRPAHVGNIGPLGPGAYLYGVHDGRDVRVLKRGLSLDLSRLISPLPGAGAGSPVPAIALAETPDPTEWIPEL